MKRSQDVRRRTANASSAAASITAGATISAAPSTVSVRSRAVEERDALNTPRQKQRAAQRLASQQQQQQQGKSLPESLSTRTENYTISSNGLTTVRSASPFPVTPTAAADVEGASGASSAVVAVPAKATRRHSITITNTTAAVGAHVALRRPPSRDTARSPRHITVGANLVTPPPAASISASPHLSHSPRGNSTGNTAAALPSGPDNWTPRRNSSSAAQDVLRSSLPGHSTLSRVPSSPCTSARSTATTSLRQEMPRVVRAARRPRAGASASPAQQLLDEGYYVASDGSANSSFSDTPRSARPASLCSTLSRKASMQPLELSARGGRAAAAAATVAIAVAQAPTVVTPRGRGRQRSPQSESSSHHSSSCSSGSSDVEFCEGDVDVHYDEEDEEQAVLSYMDSNAEASYARARSGSGRLASPRPSKRAEGSAADSPDGGVQDGDKLDRSVDLGTAVRDDEGPPSRLSVSTPPLTHHHHNNRSTPTRRTHSTHSVRGASAAREHKTATPPQTSPLPSSKPAPPLAPVSTATAAPATLSRQHSTAAAQASTRRSPPTRPATATSPPQPSPLNPHSLPPCTLPLLTDEDARERQCRHLSLHEAFFFNQSRSFWLVDDQVLAKVLEYVRLMGYEHPALKRDRSKGQPSLWSSSSAVSSPIAPGRPKKKSATSPAASTPAAAVAGAVAAAAAAAAVAAPAAASPPATAVKEGNGGTLGTTQTSQSAAAAAVADAVSPDSNIAAAANNSSSNPYAFLGRQHHLKSGKPRCAGQYANTTSTSATHLFLTFNEALRWIVEQEYVIGTVLLCCARFIGDAEADGVSLVGDGMADGGAWHPRRALLQRGKPCIPVRQHPIHFVASLVLTHYPQWGGMTAFMRTWETQIRLVLGSAAPPHQRVFKCPDDGLLLSSDLDAGNLHRVERAPEPYFFLIWLEPDNGSDKRIWFRFSVTGAKEGRTLRFRLMNAAPHAKLYRQNGMMPVWRDGASQVHWGPVDACTFRTTNHELDGEVSFSLAARNSTETIQIAFCAPYSYADLLCHVCHWHALVKTSECDMRFEERVLCRSPEGRKLHLLIVTSRAGGPPQSATREGHTVAEGSGGSGSAVNTTASPPSPTTAAATAAKVKSPGGEVVHGPYASFASGKKVVLVSGRVHPGEVTASHAVHGLISFLLSSDPRAIQLREHFIFFIVPMLNPDGVSRGHSRLDQYGNNLNRCYNDPDPESQPTVLALRRVFEHLQRTYRERFIMYLDFHSHASQSSGFIFGNNLPPRVQHWNVFFPRLVELHARHVFSFGLCRFGRVHMTSKDGASRVLFGSSLIHSYTVELTHFTDRRLYADDAAAMNNGSGVLFEVTWPPLHPTAAQAAAAAAAAAAAEESAEEGRTTSRGVGGRPGKRTNSTAAGQGKPRALHVVGGGSARPRAASVAAGAKASTTGKGEKGAGGRQRGASVSTGGRGGNKEGGGALASPARHSRSGSAPLLQPISSPTVLCQSAEVGRACLLALLDYCSIGKHSEELTVFGGMSRVLRDVKRQMKANAPSPTSPSAASAKKASKSQSAATYAGLNPIYKQY